MNWFLKQHIKKVLMILPPVRRYLSEKYTLDSAWKESAAECDRLLREVENQRAAIAAISAQRDTLARTNSQLVTEAERLSRTNKAIVAERDTLVRLRDELQGELDRQRAEMQALAAERDILARQRDELQGEVDKQRVEMQALTAARDILARERDELQGEVDKQRAQMQALAAERGILARERDELQGEVDKQRAQMQALVAERESLQAERGRLLNIVSDHEIKLENLAIERQRLFDDRAKYYDAVLAKMTTLKAQYGSLERNLARLVIVPKELMSEEYLRNKYLNLLEDVLTGVILKDESIAPGPPEYDHERRELGHDWPKFALTMIGKARMRNIRDLAETIISEGVPGDFLEAGVWRGGACIYMRGILEAYGVEDRRVWVADSFAGLPPPNPELYPADAGDPHHTFAPLVVSLDEVRANFSDYGLLDDRIQFLKGWFKDSLPGAPIKRLALLRLDGDMYESTIQTLDALYWKLSPAGFVIIDDYILPGCRKAVDDFRKRHRIQSRIEEVDGAAVYWRKLEEKQGIAEPVMAEPAQGHRRPKRMRKAR